ncbi:hypothetical protein M422DRAFT_71249 [Sphaerobolus stellatus SS14]|uniref:Uncharacterized protein n=1 Tax=Sphaerobolus stellatus (strain SS14) TaxID=990650 RepID=A0A0C9UVF3_SPHS4|nr:hypothetical protein M422DRAFT_71249 [Sphaerobolus stellatus SS14]
MDILGEHPANFGTICAVFVPTYAFLFRDAVFPESQSRFYVVLRRCLTVLVILHSLYTLRLLLSPPVNLFSLLDLPLTMPAQAIRVALLRYQRDRFPVDFQNHLLPHVERLLTRLGSFESRVTYMKFGPYALSKCEPCVYTSDFIVYTIAPTVLSYLQALILVSLITSAPTFRSAWRTPALFVLAATFFTEVWWTFDMKVQFQSENVVGWTYFQTYMARYAILLLLPFIVHLLPAHSSPSPLPPFILVPPTRPTLPHQSSDFQLNGQNPSTPKRAHSSPSVLANSNTPIRPGGQITGGPSTPFSAINGAISSLGTTFGALHVLEFARVAGLRRPELRERISDYFATADNNALYARSDPQVLEEAEKLGLGYRIKTKDNITRMPTSGLTEEEGQVTSAQQQQTGDYRAEEDAAQENTIEMDSSDEDDMMQSPLRARARQKATELANVYLRRLPAGPSQSQSR